MPEAMFDTGADPCAYPISHTLLRRHRFISIPFFLNVRVETLKGQLRFGLSLARGRICPSASPGRHRLKEGFQCLTVMHRGISHLIALNELVLFVAIDMILVAIMIFLMIEGPSGVSILLSAFGGRRARFDGSVLVSGIALLWCGDERGIKKLASSRLDPLSGQQGIEGRSLNFLPLGATRAFDQDRSKDFPRDHLREWF